MRDILCWLLFKIRSTVTSVINKINASNATVLLLVLVVFGIVHLIRLLQVILAMLTSSSIIHHTIKTPVTTHAYFPTSRHVHTMPDNTIIPAQSHKYALKRIRLVAL